MFYNCTSFKQSLATFNIPNVTFMTDILYNCNINNTGTTTNYDATLISWASQSVKNNLKLNAGASKYSSAATTSRTHLIGAHSWTITDGGLQL